eukprot:1141463-Pelagomonas_calceolata.AAC.2
MHQTLACKLARYMRMHVHVHAHKQRHTYAEAHRPAYVCSTHQVGGRHETPTHGRPLGCRDTKKGGRARGAPFPTAHQVSKRIGALWVGQAKKVWCIWQGIGIQRYMRVFYKALYSAIRHVPLFANTNPYIWRMLTTLTAGWVGWHA